jgi:hypothetical protein
MAARKLTKFSRRKMWDVEHDTEIHVNKYSPHAVLDDWPLTHVILTLYTLNILPRYCNHWRLFVS